MEKTKKCIKCYRILPITEFYHKSKGEGNLYGWCKSCLKLYGHHRAKANNYKSFHNWDREIRRWVINKLGGKCSKCGYNKCIAALDIHHLKPETKEYKKQALSVYSSWKRIGKIPEDVIILCANCHREEHYSSKTAGRPSGYVSETRT